MSIPQSVSEHGDPHWYCVHCRACVACGWIQVLTEQLDGYTESREFWNLIEVMVPLMDQRRVAYIYLVQSFLGFSGERCLSAYK